MNYNIKPREAYAASTYKKTGKVIPQSYGVKCHLCEKPTRSLKIYCKKCRWDTHYKRRVDAYGEPEMLYEEFINDPFYD
tara:strand:+ start:80 stop:316 length:237 start_codon:yes stop_codon:yes gene_type:complete